MPPGNKTSADGLVLFAHGSRDPRWAEPFQAIAARVGAAAPGVRVSLAFLEIMAPDLATSVANLTRAGARRICVVPLFLGQGGHAREDLPRLVDAVRAQHPEVDVRLAGIAGDAPVVLDALAAYCIAQAGGGRISRLRATLRAGRRSRAGPPAPCERRSWPRGRRNRSPPAGSLP